MGKDQQEDQPGDPGVDSIQKRIILWGVPRCLSSSFMRGMLSRDNCKGIYSPFVHAYYSSADRLSDRFTDKPDKEGASFAEVKAKLEGEFKGYSEVFVKEFTYRMSNLLETGTLQDKLPAGYTHTFLIRHPKKYISSGYHGCCKGYAGFNGFRPVELSFEECYKMYEMFTGEMGQKSIVIDADDLQRNPEATLKLYCEAVGIDFQESMIEWRPLSDEDRASFEEWLPWTELALKSKGFLRKTPSEFPDVTALPEVVQKTIRDATPFYEKMYERRLKP